MGSKPSRPPSAHARPAEGEKNAGAAPPDDGPLIKKIVVPFANTHPKEYKALIDLFKQAARTTELDFTVFKNVAVQALPLLPILLHNSPQATALVLDGIAMDHKNCLCVARAVCEGRLSSISMRHCGVTHDIFVFFLGLLQSVITHAELDVTLVDNPVWMESGHDMVRINDCIQKVVADMEQRNVRISVPARLLPPVNIEGELVAIDALTEGKLYGKTKKIMIEKLNDVIEAKDWEKKVDFLRRLCEGLIEQQARESKQLLGSLILPRMYNFTAQRNFITVIVENVTKNPSYKNLEKEFPSCAPRTGWPLHRRLRVAHQMALLTQYLHVNNTCIRGITPISMYYTFGENDIAVVYTNLAVLREQNVKSIGHHSGSYRFVDPKENGADRAVTAPRDVCAILRLLHYLLCFHPDPSSLREKHVVVVSPDESDVVGFLAAHYQRQFVESLGDDFFKGSSLSKISRLMASGVQSDESKRPTIDAVIKELSEITAEAQ